MKDFLLHVLIFKACFCTLVAQPRYNFDVKPILSDRCYHCHGPDKDTRKSDLRLDTEEGIKKALEDGEFIARITSDDPEEVMPPPDSKLAVSSEEIATLKTWIENGAKVESHWSFLSLKETDIPEIKGFENPVDLFIQNKLLTKGWGFLPEASPEKLIRRVSFDLTGLPPTKNEVQNFLNDQSLNAYEKMVNHFLSKEAYGERMASHWLDIARYSDSYGYQVDRDRFVWPWRDWVIKSFNENKPYSDFITEQIAGDMIPSATDEQIQATTFSRLHPQKVEGGSTEEEFRVEYVADRVHTFGTAFLGLTLECARCHDHKYDPLTQEEYYKFFSYFQNISESGLYSYFTPAVPTPTMRIMDDSKKLRYEDLKLKVSEAELALKNNKDLDKRYEAWKSSNPTPKIKDQILHMDFEKDFGRNVSVSGKIGKAVKLTGDDAIGTKVGNFKRFQPFTVSLWMRTPEIKDRSVVFHRSRAWTDSGSRGYQLLIEEGKLSWSLIHFWPGNAIRIKTKEVIPINQWHHVVVSNNGSSKAAGLSIYINGEPVEVDVIRDQLYKSITGGGGDNISIGQRFRDKGFKDGNVDEFKVFQRELTQVEVSHLYDESQIKLNKNLFISSYDEESKSMRISLQKARSELTAFEDGLQEIMVMSELKDPKPAYVLNRGSYDQRGKQVFAGTPTFLPGDGGQNRLELSRWLTSPDNPLTSRVAVNRFWQLLFGEGLVRTPEDFGSQGSMPTHPELLDWLSTEFIKSGWDIKKLLSIIVNSSTYKQSSSVTKDKMEADPENEFLGYYSRYRLPAEIIRDQYLALSGLLSEKVGGPSAKPYEVTQSFKPIGRDKGENLYRRSVYTFWKRTGPAPVMMALDASKRDVCRVKRERTSTPLQALVMLNDPQIIEASRILGEKFYNKHKGNIPLILDEMFTASTGRSPSEKELNLIRDMFMEQKSEFLKDPESSKKFLSVGDASYDQNVPKEELAALGVLANAIFNLWESIAKF
ncbi:MAG: hypothetical protein CMO38_02205 [Verrucomicrobiaceae bacterium]|nr:hypothetical protein [Verrucomicrobiaceae bacterium]